MKLKKNTLGSSKEGYFAEKINGIHIGKEEIKNLYSEIT